jgi:hypothetical protein
MIGLNRSFGCDEAPAASEWLVRRGHWRRERAADELAAYRRLAVRHRAAAASAIPV